MAKTIALTGEIDPQAKFYKLIDDYFGKGEVEKDLDDLTPEKRLTIMGKFAEFRWGKKTAEAADGQNAVGTTSELLEGIYQQMAAHQQAAGK